MRLRQLLESESTLPEVQDQTFHRLLGRGHHIAHVAPVPPTQWNGETRYHVHMAPNRGTAYRVKRAWDEGGSEQIHYYDPELAELRVHDPGERYIERTHAHLRPSFSDQIPDLGPGYIYRGGSQEEYDFFLQSGRVESLGKWNIGEQQEGLTYWATDARSAAHYANGFAPNGYKATFEHPAYVWVARAPAPEEIRHVRGTGKNEVGVTRPILADEVAQIWRGRIYDYQPGEITLVPHDRIEQTYKMGTASLPGGQVMWEQIA